MNATLEVESQIEKIDKSCENYKYSYHSKQTKFIKLGNWLEKESTIFKNEADEKKTNKPNFKRGEIIKVDFGINVGSELSNTHFAIVLNSDDNNNVDNITVIPLTSKPGYKRICLGNVLTSFNKNYQNNKTYALITQITTISKTKVFQNHIKCYCNKTLLEKLNLEIMDFLTK